MTILIKNKKVSLNYEIVDTYMGGIVLNGSEVKSLKNHNGKLDGSFLTIKKVSKNTKPEIWIRNMYIPPYQVKNMDTDTERERKILVKRSEINKIEREMAGSRLTLAPLQIENLGNKIKIKFALVRGKKKYDKREDLKQKAQKRDSDRDIKQNLR